MRTKGDRTCSTTKKLNPVVLFRDDIMPSKEEIQNGGNMTMIRYL